MKRHEERALQFHALAAQAREQGLGALLANVRESYERAAARWDALAVLNDEFVARALARRAAPAEGSVAALPQHEGHA